MVEMSDTLYERYMRTITAFPRITPEREVQLSKIILHSRDAQKTEAAVNELVQSNLLLVVHCLKEFAKFMESPGVRITSMDLISEGNISLIKAARNFDATGGTLRGPTYGSQGVRFSTYACKSIKNAMRRAIKLSRFIHIPEHHFSYWSRMKALRDEHGANLTDDVMEKDLGVGTAKLQMLKQSQESCTALLEDMGTAGNESSRWSETMQDCGAVRPSDEVEGRDMQAFLFGEMEALPERTQHMLRMIYIDESADTFADLARMFGVSKERCRQVCAHGLAVLRERIEAKQSKVFGPTPRFAAPATAAKVRTRRPLQVADAPRGRPALRIPSRRRTSLARPQVNAA